VSRPKLTEVNSCASIASLTSPPLADKPAPRAPCTVGRLVCRLVCFVYVFLLYTVLCILDMINCFAPPLRLNPSPYTYLAYKGMGNLYICIQYSLVYNFGQTKNVTVPFNLNYALFMLSPLHTTVPILVAGILTACMLL
jgi:hypothetical protein